MITEENFKMTNKQTILVGVANENIGGGAAVALAKGGAKVVSLGRQSVKNLMRQ